MKAQFFSAIPALTASVFLGISALSASAADTAPEPRLPYGVSDVVKLSRAQVSEDIIVNFVQSSGTIYNLQPNDIVYLKEQGVSDKVVNTMLDQKKKVTGTANTTVAAAPAPAPTAPTSQPAPVYTAPPTDTAAAPAASSTTYVIPYTPTTYPSYYSSYYYGWYPYTYPYPYYWGPSVSIGFGFGGYGGRYYGGHYGGHFAGGHYGGGHGGWGGHR